VNNKRLVLLHLVGNQCMVGSGEINLCVCVMGEHYALSGCDLTSRVRSVGSEGKGPDFKFCVSQVCVCRDWETLSYF
jgi:hypothetical protein